MNTNILKKCIDELTSPEFRKEYVLGMLETLYEMQESQPVVITTKAQEVNIGYTPPFSPQTPIIPNPEYIQKLRGAATVENINTPLNAPAKEEPA